MQRLINGWALLLTCTVYVGILFAIARWGDQEKRRGLTAKWRGVVYSLALAVYCTSWTFYGAVGSAAQDGWLFLPIYLGPMLIICLGWPLIERIVAISRRQRLTTIADFIAARYGKSRGLGVLVTVIATIGSIPYIALQLKAVTNSFTVTSGIGSDTAAGTDLAIVVTAALAGFAILFGTRKVDITEHHDGVMFAIAFESVIKLVAFVAVGIFALTIIGSPAPDMLRGVQFGDVFALDGLPNTFLTQLLLASAAIFCLPRQFHVAIVEARADASINMARWVFPAYLAVFSVLVVPITLAGLSTLQASSISADSYVLALPMNAGLDWLTLLAFIGGFSAATGMVIVACIALSTMISNEIVVPLLVRLRAMQSTTHNDYPWLILNARRLAIVAIAALAFVYYSLTDSNTALASIGLLSFAAAAQFAPLILLGVYWRRAHRVGALSGLAVGFVLWGYTLFLPTLASAGAISDEFIREGLFGIEALRPEALVFDLGSDPLTHGVAWSLIMNVLVMVVASLVCKQTMIERSQARTFAGLPALQDNLTTSAVPGVSQNDLRELAARFVGREHAQRSFADFNAAQRRDNSAQSGASVLRFTEKLLAGAIGAASARVVMTSALRHRGSDIGDVLLLLDETSEAIRFNRQLVEATLENMTQGVSVVDAEQRLVGWNRRYLELMDYDENLVHVGQPVAALIEHNAARGRFGDSDPAQAVAKRLKLLRSGSAYTYESQFDGGKVIQIRGQPMPGGGYVTTYTDITAFKQVEAELVAAKEQLEERVAERTAALEDAMAMLSSAKQEAEQANRSKTSFLAAAAHDLLQPLNATKLFTAVLHEHSTSMPQEQRELVDRIKSGLVSVEDLLTALLDISKLDTAAPQPHVEATPVARLFDALNTQFSPSFTESGLSLRFADTGYWVASDAALLRRILQNFVSNARRYTKSGGVLVGCRLRNDHIAIQVIDTGVGIASHDQQAVFEEFKRLPGSAQTAKRGLGLGLAIVKRIARLLGHDIRMQSVPGKGSTFEVLVPRADAATYPAPAAAARSMPNPVISEHIICVDNEPDILEAMRSLLTKWGALPATAATPNAAAAVAMAIRDEQKRLPAIMLVDYHLDDGATGLDAIAKVREVLQRDIPAIVLTADHSDDLADRVASLGHRLLFKPVKPAALRALIMSVLGSTQR